jgi:hypothetical protein
MALHDTETEAAFADLIDARFPYADREAANILIDRGKSISPNAAFCVLEEICRAPRSKKVAAKIQRELLADWASAFEHPLKEPVLRCAQALIDGQSLPFGEAVQIMEQIAQFDGQYAALNIAYFAGPWTSDDGETALETTSDRIRKFWAIKGV